MGAVRTVGRRGVQSGLWGNDRPDTRVSPRRTRHSAFLGHNSLHPKRRAIRSVPTWLSLIKVRSPTVIVNPCGSGVSQSPYIVRFISLQGPFPLSPFRPPGRCLPRSWEGLLSEPFPTLKAVSLSHLVKTDEPPPLSTLLRGSLGSKQVEGGRFGP